MGLRQIATSAPENWRIVGDANQPVFQNGWVNYENGYPPASFYKDSGRVHLRGIVKNGTISTSLPIFVLPVGYRPAYREVFPAGVSAGSASTIRADVTTNGLVLPHSGSNGYFSLSGISFRVA